MAKMWEFDAFLEDGDEDFASYVERFEHYCEVANVQEEKLQRRQFLSLSESKVLQLQTHGSLGSTERLVQTVKKNLVRQLRDERRSGQARTIQHRLDQFLFTYRNTPCSMTGKTPAQSFLSWAPRTRLSILHPELAKRSEPTQSRDQDQGQKKNWRKFDAGERVRVRGIRPGDPHWLTGTLVRRVSVATYIVKVEGQERFMHADDIVNTSAPLTLPRTVRITGTPLVQPGPATPDETEETPTEVQESAPETTDSTAAEEQPPEPLPRRSTRVRRQPERYGY
ncbi:hypothetical protein MTO96_042608 [Rhipicephalus appendiculatus]